MARIALNAPAYPHYLPNTGDGVEGGDTYQTAINAINTMMTELYGISARPAVNTAITTVGAGTLTAAGIVGGVITRSGSTTAYTDTTATAAQIIAAATGEATNDSWVMTIKNTVAFAETLAAGTGITLSGQTIIPPNSVGTFLVTITSQTAVTILGIEMVPLTSGALEANTALTTAGAGTLLGAALAGGVVTRTGPVAAYTDTTDTAALIIAALSNANIGQSWEVTIKNTVAFAATIAGGSNVTVSGVSIIPPNSVGRFLMTYNTSTTVTMLGLAAVPLTTSVLEANTAISTAGAGTLTAAAMVGGIVTRTGPTGAYSDATDTAANIIAALPNGNIGQSWELTIKNTVAFVQTITAGTSVTLSGQTLIPANSVGRFLLTYNGAGTVTMQGLAVTPLTSGPVLASTALTTIGAGTITGAGIAGGVTNRTGSTAAFTDTTDTAANIIAALPNANIGQSFIYTYYNNTLGVATFANGTGVTVTGTIVPFSCWAEYLVTYTAAATITMVQIAMGPNAALPVAQYVTAAGQSALLTGAQVAGAQVVVYDNTGTTPGNLQMPTASNLVAAIPNAQIGMTYILKIRNSSGSANTATITTNTGITLTGTMTIAQFVQREFVVTLTALTTVTVQSVGISSAGA